MIDIQGGRLYQWDIDREVIIKPRTEINEVHFAHPNDAEALVLKVNILEKDIYSANIPNILLQSSENIVIYAVNNNVTVEKCPVNVIEREKPADYVYTETEVKRWEDLEQKVIDGIGYYKPIVDENGNLNWQASNDKFPTIESINIKGTKGNDGYTPQKGVDYFTDEDIAGLNILNIDQTYTPDSENAQSGKAVAEAVAQSGGGAVDDVQINGESTVTDGVANIPITTNILYGETPKLGVVGVRNSTYGIGITTDGLLQIRNPSNENVNQRNSWSWRYYNALTLDKIDYAVKAAMCDGQGAEWTADEQAAARVRMGIPGEYELIFETILDEPVSTVSFGSLNLKSILILMEVTGTIGTGNVYTYVYSEKGNILYFPNMDILKTSKRYVANELRDIGPMYLGLQNDGQWSFQDTNVCMKGQYVPKNGEKITKCNINCIQTGETFTAGSKFMIYGVRV